MAAKPHAAAPPCHTCGGQRFYWSEDAAGELPRHPKPCRDCTAFLALRASDRMTMSRTARDYERRIARREALKNPRWFDESAARPGGQS